MKKTKVLAMLTAVVLLIGMFCICAAAETKEDTGCGQQLSLGDDLDMKFYVAADAGTTVHVSVDGKNTAYDLHGKAPVADGEGKGTYEIVVSLTAAQMTSQITLDFKQDGKDAQISSSVREYADRILKGEYSDSTKTLVKHTLNYGAAAQKYFKVNTGSLANSGYELVDYKAQLPEGYDKIGVEGQIGGVRIVGATLVFKSKITLRYIFEASSLEGVNFTANGVSYTATKKDGQFFVDIPGINPNMYATNVVLKAVNGEETLAVTYSPMHYIVRMSKKATTTEPMRALLNAMYGYYEAASAYVANSVEISLPVVSNGTISANKSVYRFGETVTLTATPANGYNLKSLTVKKDGQAIDIGAIKIAGGNYSFVAEDAAYTVEAEFAEPIFNVEKGEWDLNDQYNGSLTVLKQKDGTTVKTNADNYRGVSVKVKEYTPSLNEDGTLKKGNFSTQISFIFDNGKQYQVRIHNTDDGNYKLQNMGGDNSITGWKWQADLTTAQKEKLINGDGVEFGVKLVGPNAELWVDGTRMKVVELGAEYAGKTAQISVCLNGNTDVENMEVPFALVTPTAPVQLNVAELTGGTVTVDSGYQVGDTIPVTVKADAGYSQKLYINGQPLLLGGNTNSYSFVATEEVYNITGSFEPDVFSTVKGNWSLNDQQHGDLIITSQKDGTAVTTNAIGYRGVSIKVKDYTPSKNEDGSLKQGNFSMQVALIFQDDKYYEVRIHNTNADGNYKLQNVGGTNNLGGSKWPWLADLTTEQKANLLDGDGAEFTVKLVDSVVELWIDGTRMKVIELGDTYEGQLAKVKLCMNGNTGVQNLHIPYELLTETADVQLNIAEMTGGTVTAEYDSYHVGDTVTLTVAPDAGYSQKLYVNGKPLLMDWKQNTASFVATEEVCNITGGFVPSLPATPRAASRWDTANQAHGILNAYYPTKDDAWLVDIGGEYSTVSTKAKNYLAGEDGTGGEEFAVVMGFKLSNGKEYTFRVVRQGGKYYCQRFGINGKDWTKKELDAAAIAAVCGDGVDFKVERTAANKLTVSVNGVVYDTYTMDGVTEEHKVTLAIIGHYGNKGSYVAIPYELQKQEGAFTPISTITVPTLENGTVEANKKVCEVGDTVTLTVTPDAGYSQKLYINDEPLLLDWKTNTYSFVVTEKVYNITGSFEPVIDIVPKDAGRWHLANQAHGTLTTYYPVNNDSWWLDINGEYKSITVMAKNYLSTEESKDSGGSVPGYHTILRMVLDNGKAYAFRIYNDKGTYAASCTTESGAVTGWGNWKNINEHAAAITGDGVAFKVERVDAKTLAVSVNGTVLIRYTMEGVTADNKVVSVGINSKGNKGQYVEMPFTLE